MHGEWGVQNAICLDSGHRSIAFGTPEYRCHGRMGVCIRVCFGSTRIKNQAYRLQSLGLIENRSEGCGRFFNFLFKSDIGSGVRV